MYSKLFGLTALALAACFAGGAIYINLAEHPARLALDNGALLAHWQHSYPAALKMQSTIAIITGLLAISAWWYSRDWLWLLGAVLILANWPYTLGVMMPVNNRLMSTAVGAASAETRDLLEHWGMLHVVRSGLGLLAVIVFLWALTRQSALAANRPAQSR